MSPMRFTTEAADALRLAISDAGGIEVFAIGRLNSEAQVAEIEIHCRGNDASVPALLTRPRAGEVVIHNHPSGILKASNADMILANLYGEDGVGVVIVNNTVDAALWVVEPYLKKMIPIDLDEVQFIFENKLPKVMPGYESRSGQIGMALKIASALNEGDIALLEAGTGTGKSLAYLVPSILWATRNNSKVVVATYTITLQGQLVRSDIPILQRAGLKFQHALIKGRNNYVCRRRLDIALKNAESGENKALQSISQFIQTSKAGSRSDMGFFIDEETWDSVGSDHEQTLRAKCPHFENCFYYNARREASKANILIANHHLLLSDLMLKSETGGEGCMPNYNRVVIDEGHHLEDAATSLFMQKLSTKAVRRAVTPLMNKKKKPGSLEKIAAQHTNKSCSSLPLHLQKRAQRIISPIPNLLQHVWKSAEDWFQQIAHDALDEEHRIRRIKPMDQNGSLWKDDIQPVIRSAAHQLGSLSDELAKLEDVLDHLSDKAKRKDPQPLLDLRRCRRRLAGHALFLENYMNLGDVNSSIVDNPHVRWIEPRRKKNSLPSAVLKLAPIEVGPTLRDKVFFPLKSITACSATMTVDNSFNHFANRVGLNSVSLPYTTEVFPSPFCYPEQAVLALPNDIPYPTQTNFIERCSQCIIDSIKACDGGVFVLCTSYSMLRKLYDRVSSRLRHQYRFFRQGEMGRIQLLNNFMNTTNGVLFGADSFWEGVSIKGDQLRMVIIPRLPFRVPTDPVEQARHEHMQALGKNPFREYSLPQACLRFRQGFGRLIRTQTDRGAVVIMDSRINSMWYGKTFLRSLPELKLVKGNSEQVLQELRHFFASRSIINDTT